jgi:uncharacterized membrane protein YqjE
MVDQTKMSGSNGRGSRPSTLSSTRSAARNMARLLHDMVTLGQLQLRLFVLDCRQLRSKLGTAVIAVAVGLVLVLSCVPVALAGIVLLFRDVAGFSRLGAVWTTFALTVIVGAMCVGCGIWWLRTASNFFESSRVEFTQNIERFKEMLRRSSHPTEGARDTEDTYASERRFR